MARLTKGIRGQLLSQNEGFCASTHNSQRNFTEDRTYTVRDGKLYIRAQGKTSWADSRYDSEYLAGEAETHRFLRNYLAQLNAEGID